MFAQQNTSDPKGVATGICIHMQKECYLSIQCCIALESKKEDPLHFPQKGFYRSNLPFGLPDSSPARRLSCPATWEKIATCDLASECDLRPTDQCDLKPSEQCDLRPTDTESWRWARNREIRNINLLSFEEVLPGLVFCCYGRD